MQSRCAGFGGGDFVLGVVLVQSVIKCRGIVRGLVVEEFLKPSSISRFEIYEDSRTLVGQCLLVLLLLFAISLLV